MPQLPQTFKLGYLGVEPKAAEMMLSNHEKERIKRLEKYWSGDLPVHKHAANQDWDKLITDAKARQKNLVGSKGGLPAIRQIAEKSGFSVDYSVSVIPSALHPGPGWINNAHQTWTLSNWLS